MFTAVLASILAYISTNIDDLVIMMLLYAQTVTPAEERHISLGHTLGIGLLTLISLIGAFSTRLLPVQYVSLLGVIPIFLGIRILIGYWRSIHHHSENDDSPNFNGLSTMSVAVVTIANGADNIGVYIPLFAEFDFSQLLIAFVVFFLMNFLWCGISKRISDAPILRHLIGQYKDLAMGIVFVLIGLYVLLL